VIFEADKGRPSSVGDPATVLQLWNVRMRKPQSY